MTRPVTDGPRSFLARYRAGEFASFYARGLDEVHAALDRPGVDDPDGLADALAAQAQARGDAPQQRAAIERLRDPAARTVTTGQQAGLLLGPAFTLSKAWTAIQLARRLHTEERPVVPVFWVASQDHDAAEIDHAVLLDANERPTHVQLPFPADVPSGRTAWRDGYDASLTRQLDALGAPPRHREEVAELLRRATTDATSVADVFARLLSSLFGDQGLIVADPMRPELARRFAPVLAAELRDPRTGPDRIVEAGEALRARGVTPQLGRAENATNLFLQQGDGPRRLLRLRDDRFVPDGRPEEELDPDRILALLDQDPCVLTPAAGLRPVVQDAAFPNAVTVVGPGELAYFAQLRGAFEQHGVPMGLAWPRAQATFVVPPVDRIVARHGLSVEAWLAGPDDAERAALLRLHGHAERFERARERLERETAEMIDAVAGVDPTLRGPIRRAERALEVSRER
ncbi:MAG: bacillithiol biosynthesis cysteine-adding enzyme BshC, partial [Trueperaceae bacterium]